MLTKHAVLSVDDWKFKYHGDYLPVHHKLPGERGKGWVADNVVVVGIMVVVESRKRVKVLKAGKRKLESSRVGLMHCAKRMREDAPDGHKYVIVCDRGYCDRSVFDECTYYVHSIACN